jgi:fumarate reductase subunit D
MKMKYWIHAVDPLLWPLFGLGFFCAAFLLPPWVAVVGIAHPAGWVSDGALAYERVHSLASSLTGRALLGAAVAALLWNGSYHLRHTAMDLLGQERDVVVAPFLYAVAAAGSVMAVAAVARL